MRDLDSILIWEAFLDKKEKVLNKGVVNKTGMDIPPGLENVLQPFEIKIESEPQEEEPVSELDNKEEEEPIKKESYTKLYLEAFNDVEAKASEVETKDIEGWLAHAKANKEKSAEEKRLEASRVKKLSDYERTALMRKKLSQPIVHGDIAKDIFEITSDNGAVIQRFNIEKFKKLISQRPKVILRTNAKMKKSGNATNQAFYNTTLPAINGLCLNEQTNQLMIVNTCPGAGACKEICYARKGSYVQYKAVALNQTKTLNYIMNDFEGYVKQIKKELLAAKSKNKGKNIVLRFNDSGDMISEKYMQMTVEIAKEMPDITFYAYTKSISVAKSLDFPDNYVMNYSMLGKEDKKISPEDKQSVIVEPEKVLQKVGENVDQYIKKIWRYTDNTVYDQIKSVIEKKYRIPKQNLMTLEEFKNSGSKLSPNLKVILLPDQNSEGIPEENLFSLNTKDPKNEKKKISGALENMGLVENLYLYLNKEKYRNAVAKYFNLDPEFVLTMDELLQTPVSPERNKYNVIVLPQQQDVPASRRDVHYTILHIH